MEHHEPSRSEAVAFFLKSRVLILHRWWRERGTKVSCHSRLGAVDADRVIGEVKAPLWTQISAAEFPLTAGKVQNLRAACRRLDGVAVPAGEVFSFWKQLGRTTRRAGFTEGRELRSGCLVPNLGGGLCQLSGLIHAAAVKAGLEIVERHEHSRTLPGMVPDPAQDATVFWNYVDLRFRAQVDWVLETRLSVTDLVVTIRSRQPLEPSNRLAPVNEPGLPARAAADGDCLTCGVVSCFRHPSAVGNQAASAGHGAWLLEGRWPEFDSWCAKHTHPGDQWLMPLDGRKWKKPNYAWSPPEGIGRYFATRLTLWHSWRQRTLPAQGAARQQLLIDGQRKLAAEYAARIHPEARHLVISQGLLPYLWLDGHLGGRTFDVLLNRWPAAELQRRLDGAAKAHPESPTLADFRADPGWVRAETKALAAAARIVTPHRALAAWFGPRAILVDWHQPVVETVRPSPVPQPKWFFPASALGRKGIYEMAAALREVGGELLILGRANEGSVDPLAGLDHRPATVSELGTCTALVLPAWIEHEPRLAIRALAAGIPVIATSECGLQNHPLLTRIRAGDVRELVAAMRRILTPEITDSRQPATVLPAAR